MAGRYVPWKQADDTERQRRILEAWELAEEERASRGAAEAALAAAIETRAGIAERDPASLRWRFASSTGATLFAIAEDGTLWSRGPNRGGGCGVGDTKARERLAQVDGARWLKAWSASGTSCGLREDGTVWVWGENAYGSLAVEGAMRPNQLVPMMVGTDSDWADLSTHSTPGVQLVAIKADGSLWHWGYLPGSDGPDGARSVSSHKVPVRLGTDSDWASVASGDDFTFAIRRDGSLWVWGSCHSGGALGLGRKRRVLVPTRVGTDSDWAKVAPGYNFAAGLKSDGSLWVWGDNSWWQLGLGEDDRGRSVPTQAHVGGGKWKDVAVGDQYCIGLQRDNTLLTWGHSPTDADRHSIRRVCDPMHYDGLMETRWSSVHAGCYAIDTEGSLWECPPNLQDGMGPERVV